MARPTKAPKFTIYADEDTAGIEGPAPAQNPSYDDTRDQESDDSRESDEDEDEVHEEVDDMARSSTLHGARDIAGARHSVTEHTYVENLDFNGDLEDARRESAVTSTSISTFPESNYDLDGEQTILQMHQPYTSPLSRPAFRRPSSVRRMQMSSPGPYDRSPRRSVLHQTRSRPGTPRSMHMSVKSSPKPRLISDEDLDDDARDYPLILLHVTLIPVESRWSNSVMQELLPAKTLDNLELLRSKVSETIAQRGILIQHPKAEYELLEERLLQALELTKERVSKCGHFRTRDSVSSIVSSQSSVKDNDSAIGSDIDTCNTCHQSIKWSKDGALGEKVWSVKIFAANGLLGSSAWAAAWSDMERVDVEILPWIDGNMRRALDARQEEENAAYDLAQAQEEARSRSLMEEQIRISRSEFRGVVDPQPQIESGRHNLDLAPEDQQAHSADQVRLTSSESPLRSREAKRRVSGFPQIYRPKDIPLSVLLRNYIFLLAQDRKNVAIFILGLITLWLSLRSAVSSPPSKLGMLHGPLDVHQAYNADIPLPVSIANATADVTSSKADIQAPASETETQVDKLPRPENPDILSETSLLGESPESQLSAESSVTSKTEL